MKTRVPEFGRLAPWIAFFGALSVYWSTVEPGASLWDCPEYIEGAMRLEIGHPPGNPTWLLFHCIVSLFGFNPAGSVLAINLAAGFFTAWAVGLLCACSQRVLRPLLKGRLGDRAISLCSIFGSLCFGWADSPWFSAVEAEVYAMSLWMTALCVWLTLIWLDTGSSGRRWQLIILISYILGLSIGVHQLTMLVIPALAMIVFYGLSDPDSRARGRQWLAAVTGAVIVLAVLLGLMKGIPRLLAGTELLAVNRLGMPYNSGALVGWLAILALTGIPAVVTGLRRRKLMSGILWCVFFVCVGFSSYALILIRASACPPMNQGDPSDIFSFITYIDRDQYGASPLLHGSTPYSRPLKREHIRVSAKGDTTWSYYGRVRVPERKYYSRDKEGKGYIPTGYKYRTEMIPELEMWFPRLHSTSGANIAAYEDWTGMNAETMERVPITEAADSLGRPVPMRDSDGKLTQATELRPTALQNLRMLFGYQSGYMYFRYLLWNFAGRQNDVHSGGEVEHGNFITGFTSIDNLMLGAEDELPDRVGRDNPGRNRYLLLPFILGICGVIWLCCAGRRGRRVAGVSAVLFLMTGLAIVLYLNQTPGEPRERDYSFLGSFWVFGFWITAGMAAISIWISGFMRKAFRLTGASSLLCPTLVILGAVPVWMLLENFDDHDRSGRYPADEYADLVLNSLPENTILFTTGDNHTFPLWYARNARGVRRDVTIVNTNYLQLPWQSIALMRPDESGHRISLTMRPEDIGYGALTAVRIGRDTTLMDAVGALRLLYADTARVRTLPTSRLLIGGKTPTVFNVCERYGIAPGGAMNLKQLAMLDIVATNAAARHPRPVAWHRILASRGFEGWSAFTVSAPFAEIWSPDSAGFDARSREAILATRQFGSRKGRYIDPVYGSMISYQRMALMTDTRRAIEDGDTLAARRLLDFIAARYPFFEWGPIMKGFCGETIDEGLLFAELAETLGIHSELADSLRRESSVSRNQWRRYRHALPPRLRRAMTPASRRLSAD